MATPTYDAEGSFEAHEASSAEVWNPVFAKLRWRLRYRQGRFLGQLMTGVEVGKSQNQVFGWFVLTESDEALAAGLSWSKASHQFFMWFRWKFPGIQYGWVEHRQGNPSKVTGEKRRNVHVMWRWEKDIEPSAVAREWERVYLSWVDKIEVLPRYRLKKSGRYLAGYLSGPVAEWDATQEKFIRARFSRGWVFPGSTAHYRAYKRATGHAPPVGYMVSMANLPPEVLEQELDLDGKAFERYRREVNNDFSRYARQWNKGAYVSPEHLIENWGGL